MSDRFARLQGPYRDAFAITPSDSTDLAVYANALWVGGTGNISLITLDGTTVLISGIPAGTVLPLQVKRVRSTSTTATAIVGLTQ